MATPLSCWQRWGLHRPSREEAVQGAHAQKQHSMQRKQRSAGQRTQPPCVCKRMVYLDLKRAALLGLEAARITPAAPEQQQQRHQGEQGEEREQGEQQQEGEQGEKGGQEQQRQQQQQYSLLKKQVASMNV